ncbi:DUF2922 domain-containing protein [Ruoffia sp. FAM 24228]|uniref:DUF2922 domain-containing protein n=1 Tax=unclassified Ruoffia TaxID=2862149 RepID=UPI0038876667
MEETLNLELLFKDEGGASKKISIKNPKEGLSSQEVQSALDTIAGAEIFVGVNGDSYAVGTAARYVRRAVEEIYVA